MAVAARFFGRDTFRNDVGSQPIFYSRGWLQSPSDATGAVLAVVGLIIWAAAGVGIGALCAWIAGRLEFVVAVASGIAGISATLVLTPEMLTDAGLGAIITSVPLIGLLALGSSLAFFRRRPDMR